MIDLTRKELALVGALVQKHFMESGEKDELAYGIWRKMSEVLSESDISIQ
jgi:hypothetical protein